jgi:hypothetical protein
MLVGLNEGAKLLTELFLKIGELNIDGQIIPLHQKNLDHYQANAGLAPQMQTYRFENLWMALNQNNYTKKVVPSFDTTSTIGRIETHEAGRLRASWPSFALILCGLTMCCRKGWRKNCDRKTYRRVGRALVCGGCSNPVRLYV